MMALAAGVAVGQQPERRCEFGGDSRQSLGAGLHVPEVQKIKPSLQHRATVLVLVSKSHEEVGLIAHLGVEAEPARELPV